MNKKKEEGNKDINQKGNLNYSKSKHFENKKTKFKYNIDKKLSIFYN